jgi:hypothetical protein
MSVTHFIAQFYYNMSTKAFVRANSPLVAVFSTRHYNSWNGSEEIKLSGRQDARVQGGFTEGDLMAECLKFFENGTVKLTIEFVDTHVMQIQRDIRKPCIVTRNYKIGYHFLEAMSFFHFFYFVSSLEYQAQALPFFATS